MASSEARNDVSYTLPCMLSCHGWSLAWWDLLGSTNLASPDRGTRFCGCRLIPVCVMLERFNMCA
jgi:hypothetical protein